MNLIESLVDKKLITPPKWLPNNTHYLTITGSEAYGVSSGSSDKDINGFCFPLKDEVFPHLRGEIIGFGRQKKRFEQYQQHHIKDENARKEYDITVYSIVKFFSLCMGCNPNMLDALYTPQTCVLHCTKIANMVRDNRDIFLSKLSWHKFKGYAYSQLHKMSTKSKLDEILLFEREHDISHTTTLGDIKSELSRRNLDIT